MTENPNILRIPSLTGDTADDAYAISAGTGQKFAAPIGAITKQGVIGSGVQATDLGGASAASLTSLAPKASPAFTGTPTAPTQAVGDNSTRLATTAFVHASLPTGAYIDVRSYGAKGDGTTDDTAAIQAAINAAGPTPVWLSMPGRYLISSPLLMHAGSKLIGPATPYYFPPGSMTVPDSDLRPFLVASAAMTGQAMILLEDNSVSGDPAPSQGVVLKGFGLFGWDHASVGVLVTGNGGGDSQIEDLTIWRTTSYGIQLSGISGVPCQGVNIRRCSCYQIGNVSAEGGHSFFFNGAAGGNAGCYDHVIEGCTSVECNGAQYYVDSHCASLYFYRCDAEQGIWNATSGGSGFLVQSADKIVFDGCRTDNNPGHGWEITNALQPFSQGVVLSNCVTRRDGDHDDTANAGIYVNDAGPVIITGHNNHVAHHGDNSLFSYGPAYGLRTGSSARVALTGGWFKGLLAGVHDDGTSTVYAANAIRETYPQTTLSAALTTAAAATITVASTAGFATSGSVQIDQELITYTGTTATTFTGCTRGAASTTVAAHAAGAIVAGPTSPSTVTNA